MSRAQTARTHRLLLVEDDRDLAHVLGRYLTDRGYETVAITESERALDALRTGDFDLCILDVMMPGLDGFELAGRIAANYPSLPFFFLTARGQTKDRLRGLSLGASDYMAKPFHVEELELRIGNFLDRISPRHRRTLSFGAFELDRHRFELVGPRGARRLTEREQDLLVMLAERSGEVVTRQEILETLWGRNDYFTNRSLDVFVSRLRKYLDSDKTVELESVRGIGLLLETSRT